VRVAFISTYPPTPCGIARYTQHLCSSLLKQVDLEIYVIAERGARPFSDGRITCIPCFYRKNKYSSEILPVLRDINPDVVHLQHHYGIYSIGEELFTLLKNIEAKKVVTLHEVHTPMTREKIETLNEPGYSVETLAEHHRALAETVDRIVVHTAYIASWLKSYGVDKSKISVIHHGTPMMPRIDGAYAKRILGFSENDKVILSFGFVNKYKNQTMLIEAFKEVVKQVPEAKLLLVGGLHPHPKEEDKKADLKRKELVESLGLSEHVKIIDRFVEDSEVPIIFAAADVATYLFKDRFAEVSGALHTAIGAGRPIVCTNVPRYMEVASICPEIAVDPEDREKLVRVLVKLLKDEEFRREISSRIERLAVETSYDRAAELHYALYLELVRAERVAYKLLDTRQMLMKPLKTP